MEHTINKYFIPHEGNDHKPHLLRGKAIVTLSILVLLVQVAFVLQRYGALPTSRLLALVLPDALISQTNGQRITNGNLGTLTTNALLTAAAQQKANDMAAKGYFAHNSPDGHTPWYWMDQVGYKFIYAGENLAVNFTDSSDVTQAWMNSPGHRENILNGHYTEIGIATAQGTYEGNPTTFVVEMFGNPASVAAAAPISAATPQSPTAVPSGQQAGQQVNGAAIAETPKPNPTPAPTSPAPRPAPVTTPTPNPAPAASPAAGPASGSSAPQTSFVEQSSPETTPAAPAAIQPTAGSTLTQDIAAFRHSFVETLVTSPAHAANRLFIVLSFFVALAIFFKARHSVSRHPQLLLNGFLFLLLATAAITVNRYTSLNHAQVDRQAASISAVLPVQQR